MFFELIFTASASGFSFLPWHVKHGVSLMNCFNHSLLDSESVSMNFRCRLFNTPSNASVYSQIVSLVFASYENFITSSVPYKITLICFDFIWFIGVIKLNLYFFPTTLNSCFLYDENLPLHGTIAPSKIDFVLSGITKSGSNSILTPNPLHWLHIPNGELNENVRGSNSPTVIPQCGHALFCEKIFSFFSDATRTEPFAAFNAVWIPSKILLLSDFDAIILSTTISMLCHFCLSNFGNSSSSKMISPLTLALEYPSFFICSNNFSYVPFFLWISGAKTRTFFWENSFMTESVIDSIDCVEIFLPQFVQCGIPILANNSLI